jgi:regulator of cell morphogenesis and NO signaling
MINPQKSVASLVLDHSECAAVLQRHRIDYCCRGEASLADACRARQLDLAALVAELERAVGERGGDDDERRSGDEDARTLSSPALIDHILSRYHAPLRKNLPFLTTLAARVARVHGEHNARLVELDAIVAQLAEAIEAHIDDEEATLFPAMRDDRRALGALLDSTRDEHAAVGELLDRMRTASEDYAVPEWACNSYRTLFRELERLETDVLRHVHLENHVLLPRFAEDARRPG